jgi:hypothetical protein
MKSITQLLQKAEPQQELTTRSVGGSLQISHSIDPLATAGAFDLVAASSHRFLE